MHARASSAGRATVADDDLGRGRSWGLRHASCRVSARLLVAGPRGWLVGRRGSPSSRGRGFRAPRDHEGHESSAHRGVRVRVRLPSTAASTAGWKPRMRPCGGTALCAGSGRGTGEAIDARRGALAARVLSDLALPLVGPLSGNLGQSRGISGTLARARRWSGTEKQSARRSGAVRGKARALMSFRLRMASACCELPSTYSQREV